LTLAIRELLYKITAPKGRAVVTEGRGGDRVPLRQLVRGEFGVVYAFIRPNGRCPACDFLQSLTVNLQNKFNGLFDAFVKQGAVFENYIEFKLLHGKGKPLWEFKQHEPRIYTVRERFGERFAIAVLLDGWVKGKSGKGKEEKTRIASAITLYHDEYLKVDTGIGDENGKPETLGRAAERQFRNRH
jgi:hypothetical protein